MLVVNLDGSHSQYEQGHITAINKTKKFSREA